MYVRLYRDGSGNVFLQQLLKLEEYGKPVIQRWENVATMGEGQNEAYDVPITASCGIMLFEATETVFSSVAEGHKEVKVTHAISPLDIYKISQVDSGVHIYTKSKISAKVKMTYNQFLEIYLSLLSKFQVVRFNEDGKLI